MEPNVKNPDNTKLQLFKSVQREFNRRYPFLRIEWRHKPDETRLNDYIEEKGPAADSDFLTRNIGLNDNMTIVELGSALQRLFGPPVIILRKSYSGWQETNMTGEWSLRRHNKHGHDVSTQFC
jgi:hypothetical protein